MLLRFCALLLLLTSAYAKTPRIIADVPIQTPDRKNINLRQYRGKVVVLAMISTSCADCIQTVEALGRLQTDFAKRGLQVVGAAIETNAAYNVPSFVNRYRPSFPFGFLNQPETIKIGDIGPGVRPFVPILMFIDPKGTVRFQYYGNDPFMKQGEKGIRAVADGLIREAVQKAEGAAAAKQAPQQAAPAAPPPQP